MSGMVKWVLVVVVLIVMAIVGNIVGNMVNRANTDSSEIAQSLAQQLNQKIPPSADFYTHFKAQKDTGGPGVVLNYTLTAEYVENVKTLDEKTLRQRVINLYGAKRLQNVVSNDIYLIFNLKNDEGKIVKSVTMSKSILGVK